MNPADSYLVVLVTAPTMEAARTLAQAALTGRYAACANLIPHIESHYWWQGELESNAEVLVIFKTVKERAAELEACIVENHPYDTPEFVILPCSGGNQKYLDWLSASVK